MIDLIDELFRYNDWANAKVLDLCEGLSDEQLDEPREIGFGSLRATLFHIWSADQIWIERWSEAPWRPFERDPRGATLDQIRNQLDEASRQREAFIKSNRSRLTDSVSFMDSGQTPYRMRLSDLVLHVFNHGTHHRAQALAYLKSFGRTMPLGIDYIYYRTATADTPQSPAAVQMLKSAGLDVGTIEGTQARWDGAMVARWFQYSDWATGKVLEFAAEVDKLRLRDDFGMGPAGTILGTLQHCFDVENWWMNSMITSESQFGQKSKLETIADFYERWQTLATARNGFLSSVTPTSAHERVTINFGGPDLHFSRIEGVVQVANHGVHHRAQLINMLRHSNAPIKNIDLLYAIEEMDADQHQE